LEPAKTVAVLTPYPLSGAALKGGAQQVAASICGNLVTLGWDCTVLRNAGWAASLPETAPTLEWGDTQVARWPGQLSGADRAPQSAALRIIRTADLVLVLDRSVGRLRTDGAVVLLLSNLAYDNERRAASAPGWDAAWVPSPFLAAELLRHPGWHPRKVRVVPPVLTEPRCEPRSHATVARLRALLAAARVPMTRRLLFPHRADPGKGLLRALDLLRALVSADPRWTLTATAANPEEGPEGQQIVAEARSAAAALGLRQHLLWVPWLPPSEMSCLYRTGGCTIMASSMPEGFGLVPIESVAAGVPVVATAAGNVRHLARRFQSITAVEGIGGHQAVDAVHAAVARGTVDGESTAVRACFGQEAQLAALTSGLASLLPGT